MTKIKFNDGLQSLNTIIENLESPKTDLETSIELFKKGKDIIKLLNDELIDIEKKVVKIISDEKE